jgi:hypothetical protein
LRDPVSRRGGYLVVNANEALSALHSVLDAGISNSRDGFLLEFNLERTHSSEMKIIRWVSCLFCAGCCSAACGGLVKLLFEVSMLLTDHIAPKAALAIRWRAEFAAEFVGAVAFVWGAVFLARVLDKQLVAIVSATFYSSLYALFAIILLVNSASQEVLGETEVDTSRIFTCLGLGISGSIWAAFQAISNLRKKNGKPELLRGHGQLLMKLIVLLLFCVLLFS